MISAVRPSSRRALTIAFAVAIGSIGVMPAATVVARTTLSCGDGGGVFQGSYRKASEVNHLTNVKAEMRKLVVPLCTNPAWNEYSASSWWVMIAQTDSQSDYIQYGFWNCQTGCGWASGSTNGEVHEFWERNNGNFGGHYRVDLGNVADDYYVMRMRYSCPAGATCRFRFTRDGVLQAQSFEDGWRDWSMQGATFDMYSETWNRGDQNGGASTNRLVMWYAEYGVNFGMSYPASLSSCLDAGADYGCASLNYDAQYDGATTWTYDR